MAVKGYDTKQSRSRFLCRNDKWDGMERLRAGQQPTVGEDRSIRSHSLRPFVSVAHF